MVFTDWKGRLIGDGDVDLTGVDKGGDENETPLKTETKNYLDYQEDQEEFHPKKEYQTIQQPVKF